MQYQTVTTARRLLVRVCLQYAWRDTTASRRGRVIAFVVLRVYRHRTLPSSGQSDWSVCVLTTGQSDTRPTIRRNETRSSSLTSCLSLLS